MTEQIKLTRRQATANLSPEQLEAERRLLSNQYVDAPTKRRAAKNLYIAAMFNLIKDIPSNAAILLKK